MTDFLGGAAVLANSCVINQSIFQSLFLSRHKRNRLYLLSKGISIADLPVGDCILQSTSGITLI